MNIKERNYLKERNKIKEENNKSNGENLFEENIGLFEKRKNLVFIISLVIMFFSSIVSVFAVSSYLYNSNEVSFNNASSTSISSSNVQGAIDELYADAHNYEEMSGRVAALEGITHITNNKVEGLELNQSGILTTTGGYIDFHHNGSTADYTSRIAEYSSGQLTLNATNGINLNGSPVKVNGVALSDYFKVVWYNDNKSRTLSAHSGLNANDWTPPAQTGYTFDCVLAGYGNGDVGLMVSPNKWIYNASTATKTYSYVTWLLLYKKS